MRFGTNHIAYFYQTGKLLAGTYYFDPPLVESEIYELYRILQNNVKNSKRILNPLSDDLRHTGNYNRNRTLLWLDVVNGSVEGWQNVDISTDEEDVEFELKDLASIQKWCQQGDCVKPLRNGRDFLNLNLPNTEDIFQQVNESEDDFDWVDISADASTLIGLRLYNVIQNYFNTYNSKYWLVNNGEVIYFEDVTGIYFDIRIEDFTIEEIKDKLNGAIYRLHDSKTRNEYIDLAKTLEPIIGPID